MIGRIKAALKRALTVRHGTLATAGGWKLRYYPSEPGTVALALEHDDGSEITVSPWWFADRELKLLFEASVFPHYRDALLTLSAGPIGVSLFARGAYRSPISRAIDAIGLLNARAELEQEDGRLKADGFLRGAAVDRLVAWPLSSARAFIGWVRGASRYGSAEDGGSWHMEPRRTTAGALTGFYLDLPGGDTIAAGWSASSALRGFLASIGTADDPAAVELRLQAPLLLVSLSFFPEQGSWLEVFVAALGNRDLAFRAGDGAVEWRLWVDPYAIEPSQRWQRVELADVLRWWPRLGWCGICCNLTSKVLRGVGQSAAPVRPVERIGARS